jgi:prevent-host-death family protein
MDTINLYEAKTKLSGLVERAAAGEEIIIAKAGRPLARLVGGSGLGWS